MKKTSPAREVFLITVYKEVKKGGELIIVIISSSIMKKIFKRYKQLGWLFMGTV